MNKKGFSILIIALIMIVVIILGYSCSKNKSGIDLNNINQSQLISSLDKEFSLKAKINYDDIEVTADFIRNKDGTYTVKVLSPDYLKGLTFDYKKDGLSVSYLGLSVKLDDSNILASSISSALVNTINNALKGSDLELASTKDNYTLKGKSDSGNFNINFDKKTKKISSISVPQLNFKCDFE